MLDKVYKRERRHTRIRARVSGTAARPRLSVYRSNTSIYAQLVDDVTATTLVAASDLKVTTGTKTERAAIVGADIAARALAAGITTVVFDRGGFLYAGRVKSLADAARAAGLSF